MRFLVVDDNPAIRCLIREILAAPDTEFFEACNGEEAVASHRSEHPDWTIMDIEMPVMDGFDATAAILTQSPDARIAIITQHNQPSIQEKAYQIGAAHFFPKDNLFPLCHLAEPHTA